MSDPLAQVSRELKSVMRSVLRKMTINNEVGGVY